MRSELSATPASSSSKLSPRYRPLKYGYILRRIHMAVLLESEPGNVLGGELLGVYSLLQEICGHPQVRA